MNIFETVSAQKQLPETTSEPLPVMLELLPEWKQLVVESRQLQTVAELLTTASRRQLSIAKRRIAFLRLLRRRLRGSYLWHSTAPASLNFQEN